MTGAVHVDILPQPDDTTCGPTCLHAVYGFYGLDLPLGDVIASTSRLTDGGTLAVMLAIDALQRGFLAEIVTYNVIVFDPTWFEPKPVDLADRLRRQREVKTDPKLRTAVDAYLEFLSLGGRLRFEDLTASLLRRYLKHGIPILTGLSATYLYRSARETVVDGRLRYDDVRGETQGHFVVLRGYDPEKRMVFVADPLQPNPIVGAAPNYTVGIDRLVCSILLGIVTYDANLLLIRPGPHEATD